MTNTSPHQHADASTIDSIRTPPFATTYASIGNTCIPMCRPLPRRLVGIWAHPDDEAYLSAGLMARVTEAGGSVTVITATGGEHGTGDPTLAGTEEFARFRQDELTASLSELGVDDVRFLGIADGACESSDDSEMIEALGATLREIDPDAIVTFGPDGITGHPDHRAVSSWTTSAWARHAESAELLYATMTKRFLTENAELHDRLGVFEEYGRTPASVSTWSVALECSLTCAELDRKRVALSRHASQTIALAEVVGEATYHSWWSDETFRLPTRSEVQGADLTLVGVDR